MYIASGIGFGYLILFFNKINSKDKIYLISQSGFALYFIAPQVYHLKGFDEYNLVIKNRFLALLCAENFNKIVNFSLAFYLLMFVINFIVFYIINPIFEIGLAINIVLNFFYWIYVVYKNVLIVHIFNLMKREEKEKINVKIKTEIPNPV